MTNVQLEIYSSTWNYLTLTNVYKSHISNIMYKPDLALNNLQWFMCHKTKPNQTHRLID